MSKEKQIEETTELLWHFPKALHLNCYNDCEQVAELLYNERYRKQIEAEWILKGDDLVCSLCEGEMLEKTEHSRGCYMGFEMVFSKYCPNCGAKMKGI